MEAVVIGAGVSGLTTALVLLRNGFRVRVIADRLPAETTSAAAGATWSPYMADHPEAMPWSEFTKSELERLAENPEETGVRVLDGIEAAPTRVAIPAWATRLDGFRECAAEELPLGYGFGWWGKVPVLDMPVYLGYLSGRLLREGGVVVERRRVSDLDIAPLVINCSGVGARELAADSEVIPKKGQLVVVSNPGIEIYFQDHLEDEEMTYFVPHGDRVVLGGCARKGVVSEGYDPRDAKAIIERCARIDSRLEGARVVENRVGFRPHRGKVRVERETTAAGTTVIHNYGHGGSGVTMSWGCAHKVCELLGV